MKNLGFLPVLMLVMVCFSVVGNCYAIQISNLDKEFRLGPHQSVFITETLAPGETIKDVEPIDCLTDKQSGNEFNYVEIKIDGIVMALFHNNNSTISFPKSYYEKYHPRYDISFGIQNYSNDGPMDMDLSVKCQVASQELKPPVIPDKIVEPF